MIYRSELVPIRYILLGLSILALSACTFGFPFFPENISEHNLPAVTKSKYGNPPSYEVMGERYHVMDSAHGFTQRGVASWYGPDFHGRRTSSGERYNMYAMTAAHKTLPIPVYVRVTNLSNSRSTIVRVNDRGPFADDRIIDLSYAAAKKLGIVGPGTAEVEIEVLGRHRKVAYNTEPVLPPEKQQLPEPDLPESKLYIQVGSFGSEANAQNLLNDLTVDEEKPIVIQQVKTGTGDFYRVRLGPLADLNEANVAQGRLKSKGYSEARILLED